MSAGSPTTDPGRARGALVGLACGDAVGTSVEFARRGSFEPLTDMVGGGPFRLRPGEWTDDTSMALCLAESLLERGVFDPRDQMERYVRWWREGHLSSTGRCFDIGGTVRAALERFERTGEPFAGSTHPHAAGNGSLMRLAPVALFAPDAAAAVHFAGESSRTTHGAREAVDACRLQALLLVRALAGADREALLAGARAELGALAGELLAPKIAALAEGAWRKKSEDELRGAGYVVECLEAALACLERSTSYRDAILRAANLGDDADTTAAVCGQLAGALYGASGIPEAWLECLAMRKTITEMADGLREAAARS